MQEAQDIRHLLDQAVEAARAAAQGTAEAEPKVGEGTATDGLVKAVVVPGGRVQSVTIEPRAMRLASQDLGEHIAVAVNAALDDLAAQVATALPTAADPAALVESLQDLQISSIQRLQSFVQALEDTRRQ